MVRNIRALLQRALPTDQEVSTFHGIITYLATKRPKR
jgi:tRNA C32,U32 (ribose-2'-O)-methylase TrmJ